MPSALDRMLAQLEQAAKTVATEIESSGIGPAARKGSDATMKVMDKTFDRVDAVLAKATVSGKDLAMRATGDNKDTLNKVCNDLMRTRDDLRTRRRALTGGKVEDEARKALDIALVEVERAIGNVRKELGKGT
jgi:hypothetical protein